jgi:hypothetical protein
MHRDDTMRGKLRRLLYKVYTYLNELAMKTIDILVIHWMKLALLAVFSVSVSKATLFNLVLFILFLVISLAKYSLLKTLWQITVIFDSVIIISMYTYDVFFINGIEGVSPMMMELLGVITTEDNSNYFGKYFIYLMLMLVLVLNSYVISSEKFEALLVYCIALE